MVGSSEVSGAVGSDGSVLVSSEVSGVGSSSVVEAQVSGAVVTSVVDSLTVVPGTVVPGTVVPGTVVSGLVVPGTVVPGSVVPGSVVPGTVLVDVTGLHTSVVGAVGVVSCVVGSLDSPGAVGSVGSDGTAGTVGSVDSPGADGSVVGVFTGPSTVCLPSLMSLCSAILFAPGASGVSLPLRSTSVEVSSSKATAAATCSPSFRPSTVIWTSTLPFSASAVNVSVPVPIVRPSRNGAASPRRSFNSAVRV